MFSAVASLGLTAFATAVLAASTTTAAAAPAPGPALHPTAKVGFVGVLPSDGGTRAGAPVAPPAVEVEPTQFLDDFTGAAGSAPNPAGWRYDLGGYGWGNNELETYTNRAANAHLSGHGTSLITARGETATGADGIHRDYTSARLVSRTAVR